MAKVSTIGLDLAKHVFQLHGVDEQARSGFQTVLVEA